MKRLPFILFALGLQTAVADDYTGWQNNGKGWVPVLIEDFDGDSLNTDVWGRIPYVSWGNSDWRKYQSTDPSLVQVGDGSMRLWARYGNYTTQSNQNTAKPTYACGGVYTMNTFSFQYGYVEVRAKFNHTWGCWRPFG